MASANTLTGLINNAYTAWDIVSRELTGFIPAATMDASAEQAAVGQTIRTPIAPTASTTSITAGAYAPDSGGQTMTYTDATISKSKMVPIMWTGEEQRSIGGVYGTIQTQRFAQAFRALVNEIEADLFVEAYTHASRAYGTAGTTPFGSSLIDMAEIRRILDDNGAPASDRAMVINTAAGAKMRTLANLGVVSYAGSDQTLRGGTLLPVHGFQVFESGQISSHTAGAGTGYDINNGSGEVVGQTTLTLDGGTVNVTGIKAGDVVTFATDANNKYMVNTGLTSASGDIVIGNPGVRATIADATEMTIGGSYTPNVGFSRSALKLIARAPLAPIEGDGAADRMYMTDPNTGLTFEISLWKQYRQIHIEVALAWGVKAVQSEHIAVLIG